MVKFIDVHKVYDNGTRALRGATLKVDDGEFVFLVGPSGSGKSTVVKLITGEVMPTDGRVIVNGFNVGAMKYSELPMLRRTIGVVFQDFRLIDKKTVYENVAFAMRVVGASPKSIRKRVPYILDLVGVVHKARRFPSELSGGEQQRVAIARALVNNPKMIVADEPTGNIDPDRSNEIMTLLKRINDLGTTILVVTHERELVDKLGKRVISLKSGQIISDRMGGYYDQE